MRKMTDAEKELAEYLVATKTFEAEEYLAIGFLCNSEEKAKVMIKFLQDNLDLSFDDVFEKAVELNGF